MLKFSNDEMINKFEKLIIDGWVSIKSFETCKTPLFEFLNKYSERCYCICGGIYGSTKIIEYAYDPKISSKGDVCSNPLLCFNGCVILKKIKVSMHMKIYQVVICLETMIELEKSLKQYEFDFTIKFTLAIDDEECVDNMILAFERFEDFLETHEIKVNDLEIDLKVDLAFNVVNRFDVLTKIISSDYYVKKIKAISLYNPFFLKCNFRFMSISNLKYLETIIIENVKCVDYLSLGSLKSMKCLKEIVFADSNIDYSWMNEFLPDCIEEIRIGRTEDFQCRKSMFKIPSSLKIFQFEIDKNRNEYDFSRFDFTNAFNLSHCILNNNYSFKQDEIIIKGLKEVPKNLKCIIFYDDFNTTIRESRERIKISGIEKKGIYSNINRTDNNENLILVRN